MKIKNEEKEKLRMRFRYSFLFFDTERSGGNIDSEFNQLDLTIIYIYIMPLGLKKVQKTLMLARAPGMELKPVK